MNEIYYDYVDYWKHEGELSKIDSLSFRLTKEHTAQEQPIVDAVIEACPESILEIGAGWGRIAKLLRDNRIAAQYTAMDLSYHRLKEIQDKSIGRIVGDFMTYDPLDMGEDTNTPHYDLILAIEVLMHIPPNIVEKFVEKMKHYTDTIIVLDYDPEQPRQITLADHNFLHNYDKLFPDATVTQVNYVQKMRVWKNE